MSKQDDATQQGVSDDVEQQTTEADREAQEAAAGQEAEQERQLTPREEKMQALVDRHNSERGETDEIDMHPDYVARNAGINSEDDEPEPDPEPENKKKDDDLAGLPPQVYRNEDGDISIKLKVNGQEREVPWDKYLASAQKYEAGDSRLQQAAEVERQLREREQQLAEREQRLSQPPEQPGADKATLQAEAQELLEEIYEGESDTAANKLVEFMQRQNAPTVDIEQITRQAEQNALRAIEAREFDRDLDTGFEKFQETYSDIAQDQDLMDMADRKTITLQQEHPDWSPSKILMEAGREVSEWVDKRFGAKQEAGKSPSNRAQRKKNLKPLPEKQSNSAYIPPKKEEADNSPHAVIQRMKAARAGSN